DITEFKHLEVMRKDFVANVSHELKTPITSIKGFAETLLDGAQEEKETREYFLSIIHEESKRIQRLIDDLLILSKLEKDESKLNIVDVTMNKIIHDIKPIIQQQVTEKDIKFVTTMTNDSIRLQADEEKVKQLLINLLTNAVNYTGQQGEISLHIEEDEDNVK